MTYLYSATTNGMYPIEMKDDYQKAGSWPSDGVEVSDDTFMKFSQNPPDGKVRGPVDGAPAWVDIQPPTPEESVNEAEEIKDGLIFDATKKITIWQTKLLMGRKLTDSESASLNLWMDYIDALGAIDITKAPGISWPDAPE